VIVTSIEISPVVSISHNEVVYFDFRLRCVVCCIPAHLVQQLLSVHATRKKLLVKHLWCSPSVTWPRHTAVYKKIPRNTWPAWHSAAAFLDRLVCSATVFQQRFSVVLQTCPNFKAVCLFRAWPRGDKCCRWTFSTDAMRSCGNFTQKKIYPRSAIFSALVKSLLALNL